MSYNVENLFDTEHDPGKNDWTFLPLDTPGKQKGCEKVSNFFWRKKCFATDWTESKLRMKIKKIKTLLTKERKVIPDILAIQEIENENVTRQLADSLGYKSFVITNSPDRRGIDVALLYNEKENLKYVDHKEHVIEGENFIKHPTRNILEVEFLANGQKLVIFVNHWPSQAAPSHVRVKAAKQLKLIMNKRHQESGKTYLIALGDFNTIESDYPHPFKSELLTGDFKLKSVHKSFMRSTKVDRVKKNNLPFGTYFYFRKMTWNILDQIFTSTNFNKSRKGLHIDINSYQIYSPKFVTHTFKYNDPTSYFYGTKITKVPKRYDFMATNSREAGYSDHFPVVFRIY